MTIEKLREICEAAKADHQCITKMHYNTGAPAHDRFIETFRDPFLVALLLDVAEAMRNFCPDNKALKALDEHLEER